MKIDFSGTISIWMGVRDTDRGRRPIAKSVEFSSVSSREGHHLLGQSLRKKNPLFAALFGSGPPIAELAVGDIFEKIGGGRFAVQFFDEGALLVAATQSAGPHLSCSFILTH